MISPFKVLGVVDNTPTEECRKAYRKLCAKYHPDNSKTGDREKFDEVQKAWGMIESGNFMTFKLPKSRSLSHRSLFEFSVVFD